MNKPERGAKRVCACCGTRFFDFDHDPVICPKCQAVFVVPEPPQTWRSGFVNAPKPLARAPIAEAPEDLLEPDEEETVLAPEEDEEAPQALDEDEGGPPALDEGVEVEESDLGQDDLSDEE